MAPLLPALSGLFLAALAAAGRRRPDPCVQCSPSSPLRPPQCQPSPVPLWDDRPAQAPLGHPARAGPEPWPWAAEAECTASGDETRTYCVFSAPGFGRGRGISVLTTPERAEAMRRMPAFADAAALAGANSEPDPPFEERRLPGRGRGLVANKTLHRGDRIFAYTPILVLDGDAFAHLDGDAWTAMEAVAVAKLPPASRELFWKLHGEPDVNAVSDRVDTNSFEVEVAGVTEFIVVPEIARINHDCRPNAVYFFDAQTLTHHVHAVTDILPGTEITITYIDPRHPRRQRLADLFRSWNFNCSCSACSVHPELADASDARLADIAALTDLLEGAPDDAPQMAEALVSLHLQERLHGPSTNAHRLAALAFCARGQRWPAVRHARLAAEIGMLSDGFRDDHVQHMVRLADDPEAQACWPGAAAEVGPEATAAAELR